MWQGLTGDEDTANNRHLELVAHLLAREQD